MKGRRSIIKTIAIVIRIAIRIAMEVISYQELILDLKTDQCQTIPERAPRVDIESLRIRCCPLMMQSV